MKMSIGFILLRLASPLVVFSALAVRSPGKEGGPLHLEKEIPLPGVEGRIDHFVADNTGQRLFVAALGDGCVEIVDVQKGERTAEIKGLKEPQGTFYDAKTNQLYVATGGDGKLWIYDGTTLEVKKTVEFGDDADNVRYDRRTGAVWVGYGNGGIGIVNSVGEKVGAIELKTHPESFQLEETGDRVYVNMPKQLGVCVIDRQKRVVITKWGLGLLLANYPMALDEADKRLFVGCRLPARLVVLDANSGRIISSLASVGDADDVFCDSKRHFIYVIGGEGVVEIFSQHDPEHYESVEKELTAPGARTGFFAPSADHLYVAVPHRGFQAAKILVYTLAR
jgi:DNA-binding beta-propeller fold protein YncE